MVWQKICLYRDFWMGGLNIEVTRYLIITALNIKILLKF